MIKIPAILMDNLCLFVPRLRLLAIGLLIHIGVDASDCPQMAWSYRSKLQKPAGKTTWKNNSGIVHFYTTGRFKLDLLMRRL